MSCHQTIQMPLDLGREIVVDLFAGGGGASCGIEQGIGRPVDVAINHDPLAVAMHEINHPNTRHFCESVFKVSPIDATGNLPVGLLWLSPDCTHHSKAKGGKPVSNKRRGLAWVGVKWARRCRPRVIMAENVEEFADWGPLTEQGRPCQVRKGQTFRQWVQQLERLGYEVQHRVLRACDHGAPTIRKRLFVIARRDGRPIVWPKATHGEPGTLPVSRGRLEPFRSAAECIDWTIPVPSIFDRKRPLADNTKRRIAKGVKQFVIEADDPFILDTDDARKLCPMMIAIDHGSARSGCSWSAEQPLTTITTENLHALVVAFLAKHYTGVTGSDLRAPIGTVTTKDHHSLVAAFLAPYYGSGSGETGRDLRKPAPTITTKDRLQLITVTIRGTDYVITDIGMRMLQPHELFKTNGFPDDYKIDFEFQGRPVAKYQQTHLCGNSVPPPWPRALVAANFAHEQNLEATA
ncbi:DNA (cytosine-5)-methyltransferase 1 [Marinobacter phage AS1]|nr:DNA (cytosine-5)-methyltransferase 1 [Marinobacter phage AS1]